MTTLETTKCVEHNPYFSAISEVGDFQYTFCKDCEQNIDRYWLDFGMERLPMWSDWEVTKWVTLSLDKALQKPLIILKV
jgi:hypothetical protein